MTDGAPMNPHRHRMGMFYTSPGQMRKTYTDREMAKTLSTTGLYDMHQLHIKAMRNGGKVHTLPFQIIK